jgi:hypothetical protein
LFWEEPCAKLCCSSVVCCFYSLVPSSFCGADHTLGISSSLGWLPNTIASSPVARFCFYFPLTSSILIFSIFEHAS